MKSKLLGFYVNSCPFAFQGPKSGESRLIAFLTIMDEIAIMDLLAKKGHYEIESEEKA